jgi:IstB-like ATP binding protein
MARVVPIVMGRPKAPLRAPVGAHAAPARAHRRGPASASSSPLTSSTTSSPPRPRTPCTARLAAWSTPELLLVGELGYLTFDSGGADLLYQVFNRRYQRASTTIADRLVHKGLLIRITGKSARSNQQVQ